MDPFDVIPSAVRVGGHAIHSAREIYNNYRDAETQMRHAKTRSDILESILENESFRSNPKFAAVQSSLEAIGATLPNNLETSSRRRRLLWAAKDNEKSTKISKQLLEIETMTSLGIALDQLKAINEIHSSFMEMKGEFCSVKEQVELNEEILHRLKPVIPQQYNHVPQTRVYHWMSNYLGLSFDSIISQVNGQIVHNILLHFPLSPTKTLRGKIQTSGSLWPSLLKLPWLRIQNTIPFDSSIVGACSQGDTALIRRLIYSGNASPNDTTEDKKTLLHFAIQNRNLNAVEELLLLGADPNLTYGKWETSPLNTAFFVGDAQIVRALLGAGAELQYTNCRLWTSARYIFDLGRLNPSSPELLDICASQDLGQWDVQDGVGWTILHRAAAYGQGSDIRRLLNLQASPRICTFQLKWLPIFCAVNVGNESTFNELANSTVMSRQAILKLKDSRGWTLLHLAAQSGSVAIITKLLQLGFQRHERTDSSRMNIPEELQMRELIPEDIATYYRQQNAYEQALRAAGVTQRNTLNQFSL